MKDESKYMGKAFEHIDIAGPARVATGTVRVRIGARDGTKHRLRGARRLHCFGPKAHSFA